MNDYDEKYYLLITTDERVTIRFEDGEKEEAQKLFDSSDHYMYLKEYTVEVVDGK